MMQGGGGRYSDRRDTQANSIVDGDTVGLDSLYLLRQQLS